jgi:PrcB C-terminal
MVRRSSSTRRGNAVAAVACALVAWVAWQELWAHGGDTPLSWVDLTSHTVAQPSHAGARAFAARGPLLHELRADDRFPAVPAIDFARETAILVAAGPRSSSAYRLRIVRVVEERRRIVVRVRERTPSLAEPGAATLTFPFRLITIERRGKPVTLEWEGRP